ncbi:hypothetical protein GGI00_000206 [Coemansia sp. RSA 2681]|nr:hypothetical protein GGI00_000206 [Coemansia sp. RSA 2681]
MVVAHLVGSTRVLSSGVPPDSEEHKLLMLPLLWVCRNFRETASVTFYKTNSLKICGNKYHRKVTHFYTSPRLRKFFRCAHHLAREVYIILDNPSVFYRGALEVLCKVQFDFPQARKLIFVFHKVYDNGENDDYIESNVDDKDDEGSYSRWCNRFEREFRDGWPLQQWKQRKMPMVQANIESFAQVTKMMAPLVREVEVLCGMVGDDEVIESKFAKNLMAQLFRLAPRIAHSLYSMLSLPVKLRTDGICDLTHVDIETGDIGPVLQLARQSAMTLQYICTNAHNCGDISELIKDTTSGNYVEYRQLRVLKLDHYTRFDSENKPVAPGAVLFPHLRLLPIANNPPFGDDMLFRGNAATLEFLKMKLAREDVMMLQKHRVFTPHSHPKLQSVDVWFEEDKMVGIFPTHAVRLQFLFDIGPGAAVRVFSHMSGERCIPAMLSLLGNYPGIQMLRLLEAELQLWDAIVLLNSLPLLLDMHVQRFAYGQLPSGISSDELHTYMLSQYEQMGD